MSKDDTTKQRIMLAAGPIFAKKGFRGATVREISDAAKVNLASINYYFGDKQQLYIDTVFLARQMRVQQVPFPKWETSTPAEEKLSGFVDLMLRRLMASQSMPWPVRLLMREIMQPTEACRQLSEEYFRPFFEALMTIIDEIAGRELPLVQRRQMAFSVIGQCLYYRFAGDVATMLIDDTEIEEQFEIESLKKHIADFSIAAIRGIACGPDAAEVTDMKRSSTNKTNT